MTQSKFKLITGASQISKAITSVCNRGRKLEQEMHVVAVSTLAHAGEHGDITLAQKFIEALPKTARRNALIQWYLAHGKFRWDEANKTLAYDKTKQTMLSEAMAVPFWEFMQEPEFKPLDIAASVLSLLNRVRKAEQHGQEFSEDEQAAIKTLEAMVTSNDGEKF